MIIPKPIDQTYRTIVTLEEYAQLIDYSEAAIYGVFDPSSHVDDACRDIWTLRQRNYLLRYLEEAQEEIENATNRLFQPTWITGEIRDTGNIRLTDKKDCDYSFYTKWNNVIEMGRKTVHNIALEETVDHTFDPASIGPIPVNTNIVKDINFIKIYYPNTELEIHPSLVTITRNEFDEDVLYIEIPRPRTVKYELRNNPVAGLRIDDVDNFQETVDIKYLYTTDLDSIQENPDKTVSLHYLAGEIIPTKQQIEMIVRLAHVKMAEPPCGCESALDIWRRDRHIPDILTSERLNNPFGPNDGAMIVYQWMRGMRKMRFGTI